LMQKNKILYHTFCTTLSLIFISSQIFAQRAMYHASNRNILTSVSATSVSNALDFNGINDYVDCGANASLNLKSSMTVELWIKPNQNLGVNKWDRIIHKEWPTGYFFGGKNGATNALAVVLSGDLNAAVTPDNTIDVGVWQHVAFVFADLANTIKIYKNGVVVSTANWAGTITGNPTSSLTLSQSAESYNGAMDDIRIWNVARSQADIQANMNNELSGTETGLVAYYPFNQGIAAGDNTAIATITDKTANALNGTLNNFTKTGATSNFVIGKVSSKNTTNSSVPVTNGLVLNLDPGNTTSYPGSGATWFDLSGNGNHATLVNSPTYNSTVRGGVFAFNGTNQYVSTSLTPSNTCSISIWFYNNLNYTDYNRGIFSTYKFGGPYNGIYMGIYASSLNLSRDGNVGYGSSVIPTLNINTWYNITVTTRTGAILVYLNGILQNTINGSTTHADVLNIARSRFDTNYWSGYIGTVLLYNRELTSTEVTQNYNSIKSRYGL